MEDSPNEIIEHICKQANLQTLLRLSETSWRMNQICSKEIKKKKEEYLEEKRLCDLVDKYMKIFKLGDGYILSLGSYKTYTKHDIAFSDIHFDDEITEKYVEGEKPILTEIFSNRDFMYRSNVMYSDGTIFEVLILKGSTNEDREIILRKLAEMNVLKE